jgi:hypothetical protein
MGENGTRRSPKPELIIGFVGCLRRRRISRVQARADHAGVVTVEHGQDAGPGRGPGNVGGDAELRSESSPRLDPAGIGEGEISRQRRILDQQVGVMVVVDMLDDV